MATIPEQPQQIKCFACGSHAKIEDFGRLGEIDFLNLVQKSVKDGTFQEIFHAGISVRRQMDPTATSTELAIHNAIKDVVGPLQVQQQKDSKILASMFATNQGTGKGDLAELITAETLRQKFPDDEFETAQAISKHGTDIIATVYDRKKQVGRISISVKDTKIWSNEYTSQLEGNMNNDLTSFGLLVSKKMPARANQTGEVRHNNGLVYFLVTPQYMTAIYSALREVVIYKHKTDQSIRSTEQQLLKMEGISKGLVQWISGEEFQNWATSLERIEEETVAAIDDCQKSIQAVTKHSGKAISRQQKIQSELLNTEGLVDSLKDILSSCEIKEERK